MVGRQHPRKYVCKAKMSVQNLFDLSTIKGEGEREREGRGCFMVICVLKMPKRALWYLQYNNMYPSVYDNNCTISSAVKSCNNGLPFFLVS